MPAACENCLTPLVGPYCAQCGQHAHASARTLRALLHDDAPERRRAKELARALRSAGGPTRVADLVEELGRTRRAVRAHDVVEAQR